MCVTHEQSVATLPAAAHDANDGSGDSRDSRYAHVGPFGGDEDVDRGCLTSWTIAGAGRLTG